jgi:hypothetical protein
MARKTRPLLVLLTGALFALTATEASAATLKADYRFQNTLASSVGTAPPLVSEGAGGAFTTETVSGSPRTVWAFASRGGLRLNNVSSVLPNVSDYSIVAYFNFDAITGYRKIVDYRDLGSDNGLYDLDSSLNFYPFVTGPPGQIPADTYVNVVLTRDAAGNVKGCVDGTPAFQFTDSNNDAVANVNDVLHFFIDDPITGGNEQSSGAVARLRLYSGAVGTGECLKKNALSLPAQPPPTTTARTG